jgi:hypothetical protein
VHFFRGTLDGTTYCVTPHQDLPGARRISDPQTFLGDAEIARIAGAVAQSTDNNWFGVDVSQLTPAQKPAWVVMHIIDRKLWVHIAIEARPDAPLRVARLKFKQDIIYVTDDNWVRGTLRVTETAWLKQNAKAIAASVAQSRATNWFGIDVSQYDMEEKIDWLENNILSGSLRIFYDDPNAPAWPWKTPKN